MAACYSMILFYTFYFPFMLILMKFEQYTINYIYRTSPYVQILSYYHTHTTIIAPRLCGEELL